MTSTSLRCKIKNPLTFKSWTTVNKCWLACSYPQRSKYSLAVSSSRKISANIKQNIFK